MRKYFFKEGDNEKGPFSLDQLLQQKIKSNSPIWFEDLGEWVAAAEVEELEEYLQQQNAPNIYSGFNVSNNFGEPINNNNQFAISIGNENSFKRNSMSLSILVYGILILVALMVLSNT